MRRAVRPGLRGLKGRIVGNVRRTSPAIVLRIISFSLIFLPWLVVALVLSWIKMLRWRRVEVCRDFMRRNRLTFEHVDLSSLEVISVSGGVSNSNQIWKCKTKKGKELRFFVKIFVSAGSFWAKNLSLVSPFPQVHGGKTHERFTVDIISRVQLEERGVPVPRLITYDAVQQVMVTEYIEGENVDTILKRIAARGSIEEEESSAVRICGEELAKVHLTGFSLIDTQPVNCIWSTGKKKIYFTDLEFCTSEDKRAWDVGFFLCFLALRLSGDVKREVKDLFLEGYQEKRDLNWSHVSGTAEELKAYLPIFRTILDIRQFTPEELFEELIR